MSGYRRGHIIANRFMSLLTSEEPAPFPERLKHYLDREDDPRLSEIFDRLNEIVHAAELR